MWPSLCLSLAVTLRKLVTDPPEFQLTDGCIARGHLPQHPVARCSHMTKFCWWDVSRRAEHNICITFLRGSFLPFISFSCFSWAGAQLWGWSASFKHVHAENKGNGAGQTEGSCMVSWSRAAFPPKTAPRLQTAERERNTYLLWAVLYWGFFVTAAYPIT